MMVVQMIIKLEISKFSYIESVYRKLWLVFLVEDEKGE
jgi:hypothetical protein